MGSGPWGLLPVFFWREIRVGNLYVLRIKEFSFAGWYVSILSHAKLYL